MVQRRDLLKFIAVSATLSGCGRINGIPVVDGNNLNAKDEADRYIDFRWIDSRLEKRVEKGYFDGIGFIVGSDSGVLHKRYFGEADESSVLHVASAGKWVASAVVASVVDDGLIDWDVQVKDILPEFSDLKGAATLRQLMSHTSGYPDYQPEGASPDNYNDLSESVSNIEELPIDHPPGEKFSYGGLGMQVAGRMIEVVSGKSFNNIFNERIAHQIGMENSGFTPVSEEPGFSPMLGGGFYTTLPDYGRFLNMISQYGVYDGRRILSKDSIIEMEKNQVDSAVVNDMEYVEQARADDRDDIYGLGVWREEVLESGKATLVSSPGWAGAYPWVDRTYNIWGFVLAKANVELASSNGYDTFLGSSIYPPMTRTAIEYAVDKEVSYSKLGPLFVEWHGSGEPLFLVHGHSLDRRQWEPQIEVLSRFFQVIVYDLRGYGRSDNPESGSSFLHASDLVELMNQMRIKRARFVGLSLGGSVLADLVALHPERVVSAVMAGGDFFDTAGPSEPITDAEKRRRKREIKQLKEEGLFSYKRRWFNNLISSSGSRKSCLKIPLWRMIDEWQAWQPLNIEPRSLLGRDLPRYLRRSDGAKVLIVRGELEYQDKTILTLIRNAQYRVIPDCGHISNMERPKIFNDLILQFMVG